MKVINKINELRNTISNGNVCLKFSAEWCGPCRVLSNTINDIEEEFNMVNFIEVDVDDIDDDSILDEYKIKNIPVLYLIKDGLIFDKTIGSISKNDLINKLNNF